MIEQYLHGSASYNTQWNYYPQYYDTYQRDYNDYIYRKRRYYDYYYDDDDDDYDDFDWDDFYDEDDD